MTATDFSGATAAPATFLVTGRFHANDNSAQAEARTFLPNFSAIGGTVGTGTRRAAWQVAVAQLAAAASADETTRARALLLDLYARDEADV